MLGDNVLDAEASGIKGEDRGILILTGEGSRMGENQYFSFPDRTRKVPQSSPLIPPTSVSSTFSVTSKMIPPSMSSYLAHPRYIEFFSSSYMHKIQLPSRFSFILLYAPFGLVLREN